MQLTLFQIERFLEFFSRQLDGNKLTSIPAGSFEDSPHLYELYVF